MIGRRSLGLDLRLTAGGDQAWSDTRVAVGTITMGNF